MRHFLKVGLVAAILPVAPAFAAKPSFDCAGAKSLAERTICANEALARDDMKITELYRAIGKALDQTAGEAFVNDQKYFIQVRDAWAESETDTDKRIKRLQALFTDRIHFLRAIDTASSDNMTGDWRNTKGTITVERSPDGTLKAIVKAADPVRGSWVCQAEGNGKPAGNVLSFKVKDTEESEAIALTKIGPILGVDATGNRGQIQQGGSYCGLNGSVTGWYFKVRDGAVP
ncbi:DUF1311 domain-containing protein [Agrobacterium rhizogenes]|nr:DUF1311 domain-containing protein [Rhizobium rhizogenes]